MGAFFSLPKLNEFVRRTTTHDDVPQNENQFF